jgi:protein tyrosine phosphatase (PTP) superfamily phosphohydrolase (DUF442 family)
MPILEDGSQPTVTGNLVLTDVISVSPDMKVDVATSLVTDGIFTFSNIRPVVTDVISVSPDMKVDVATSLVTDGIFTFSNIRPVLTGFTGIALGQPGSGPAVASAPVTRQILIR